MTIHDYINQLDDLYKSGKATEHSYRGPLQECLRSFLPNDIQVTNEPKRQKCGAPDYILTRRNIDIGYIEAKDIGVDIDRIENQKEKGDQFVRYRESLDNLILTDYMEFRFFLHGEKTETIKIAEIANGRIKALPENFQRFQSLFQDFSTHTTQTIKSAKQLAQMMAKKASLMKEVFQLALADKSGDHSLSEQLYAFRKILVHDMTEAQFADVYAQTIAYGLFTARLHDKTLSDFSRGEALTLIPKSNPFLRQLFVYVAGPDLDERVVWIVDALCEVYRATDLRSILKDFGNVTGKADPIIHFYETFLAEYDPALRKSRGVWYTPEPVVGFIVRAVDDVLKTHFGLKDGIKNTSKVNIKLESGFDRRGKRTYVETPVHKVQLLDVATGTGTFLAEAVKQIYRHFEGQEGLWSEYVEDNLLPRLHGFELLMASYAMCHMKLDLLLQQTGYKPTAKKTSPRVGVYLTNALEEYHAETDMLPFTEWLTREANEANHIKKNMPIMIAFGNPPYSGHSSNKGEWMDDLLDSYKVEPSGGRLKEKNSKWLNDDYVKFIRLGQHYIWKNGEGILAYITNHSYLDNPTFRGMRWNLLNAFDDIYILDLHGNTKKKETAPDGKPDKNVFDIQQGVAIIIAIKKKNDNNKKIPANVYHADLWGNRQEKYDFLEENSIADIGWHKLAPSKNTYLFIPRDETLLKEYTAFPSITDIMKTNVLGFQTHRDQFAIDYTIEGIKSRINSLNDKEKSDDYLKNNYKLKDNRDWQLAAARQIIQKNKDWEIPIINCSYRPFDNRYCYFSYAAMDYPRKELLEHVAWKNNVCLNIVRQTKASTWQHAVVSKYPTPAVFVEMKDGSNVFPLYLYQSEIGNSETKTPNINSKIYASFKKTVSDITPETLFDYIYAVLHKTSYKIRYFEFLKSDFPRIPPPKNKNYFHALAKHGAALRELHLMESPLLDKTITTYPMGGDHIVKKLRYEDGKVWINETQYFGGVPDIAWNFYIGGYQPAQKWLKDRQDRALSHNDIRHYQRIIVALTETDRIIKEIDQVD